MLNSSVQLYKDTRDEANCLQLVVVVCISAPVMVLSFHLVPRFFPSLFHGICFGRHNSRLFQEEPLAKCLYKV